MKILYVLAVFAIALASWTFGKRIPEHIGNIYTSTTLKPTCPDGCIYFSKCGVIHDYRDKEAWKNPNKSYVASGDGYCFQSYNFDKKLCPFTTMHDCIMQCGGEICAYPENMHPLDVNYAQIVKVYKILNNPKIDIMYQDDNKAWYFDYINNNNESGIWKGSIEAEISKNYSLGYPIILN